VVSAEVAKQAAAGRSLRLMFEDEARFGRISDPRRAWAPPDVRPRVASRIVREYGYAYAAVSPHDGVLDSLVLPEVNADTMSLFLAEVARRHPRQFILMVLDGAGWHRAGDLVIPERMRLYPLPARSPELNPTEHVWDELREKWLANRMFDGQETVDCQVQKGLAALEKDRLRVASLAGFPWITNISLQPK
jgi:transposase